MIYALMGYLHTAVAERVRMIRSLAEGERGQGTVEYVGLILLVSLLMVGMVAAMKGFNRKTSKTGYCREGWMYWPRQAAVPPVKSVALPRRGESEGADDGQCWQQANCLESKIRRTQLLRDRVAQRRNAANTEDRRCQKAHQDTESGNR